MKIFLGFLVLASILFSAGFVAASLNQTLSVNVNQVINVAVSPANIVFAAGNPGQTVSGNTTSFDPSGSNVNMIIVTASVTGKPFDTGLRLDSLTPNLWNMTILCQPDNNSICNYNSPPQNLNVNPTLIIPSSFAAGSFNGVITYTITGSNP